MSQFSQSLLPARVKPLSASLKLTENCQAKCVTCNYWQTRWDDGLNTEKAVDVINRLGEFGIRYLRFTGGEPLLRRDLFQVMQKAKMASARTSLRCHVRRRWRSQAYGTPFPGEQAGDHF